MFKNIKNGILAIYNKIKLVMMKILLVGVTWTIILTILRFLDSRFVYDPRLNSHKKVIRKIREYKTERKKDYAILICGSGALMASVEGFKKNLQAAYDALIERGFNDKNIIILSNTIPKKRDLKRGITARPTLENFRSAVNLISERMKPKGLFLFYHTGYGEISGEKDAILLTKNTLRQDEFADYFKDLKKIKKIFILDQDYSGGFASSLKELPKTLIMSSTIKEKMSVPRSPHEPIFWGKIKEGVKISTAYKSSIKQIGMTKKLFINLTKILSWGDIKNSYLIFGNKNIDLPKK